VKLLVLSPPSRWSGLRTISQETTTDHGLGMQRCGVGRSALRQHPAAAPPSIENPGCPTERHLRREATPDYFPRITTQPDIRERLARLQRGIQIRIRIEDGSEVAGRFSELRDDQILIEDEQPIAFEEIETVLLEVSTEGPE
jgi:hypothetical protein